MCHLEEMHENSLHIINVCISCDNSGILEHKWQLSQHVLVPISKTDSCSFVLSETHLGLG